MSADSLEGGCYCGAVRYRARLPIRVCYNCHCSVCRRLSGTDYTTWVGLRRDGFEITHGQDALHVFGVAPTALPAFCTHCGSPVWGEDANYPTAVGVLLGTVDAGHGITPSSHTYYDSRAAWLDAEATIPRHGVLP